jgi:hypothetical protein
MSPTFDELEGGFAERDARGLRPLNHAVRGRRHHVARSAVRFNSRDGEAPDPLAVATNEPPAFRRMPVPRRTITRWSSGSRLPVSSSEWRGVLSRLFAARILGPIYEDELGRLEDHAKAHPPRPS